MLFHVDNVDNFVHNSNTTIFQPFLDVDNFYTIFRVIHIFPHYSTRFVQFAICSILFDFFCKTKELQFCKLPKTITLYCLTTQTIYREGIFVPKPPRSPHPRLQLRPDEDFWYGYRLLQRFPAHW